MIEAEKGSVFAIGMHPSRWGEKGVSPANARTPTLPGTSTWITQTLSHGKSLELPLSGNRQITRISCQYSATQRDFRVQCRMAGPRKTLVPAEERPKINLRKFHIHVFGLSGFRLGGIDRRPADNLAHLAGLLSQRAHLRLHIFAMQLHYFGQILGVQQRLRIVERCLHVLFGIGNRLGADVLGAGGNRRTPLLDGPSGLLRAGEEFLKGGAGLIEAGLGHRSDVFRNLETLTALFAHVSLPVADCSPTAAPIPPV